MWIFFRLKKQCETRALRDKRSAWLCQSSFWKVTSSVKLLIDFVWFWQVDHLTRRILSQPRRKLKVEFYCKKLLITASNRIVHSVKRPRDFVPNLKDTSTINVTTGDSPACDHWHSRAYSTWPTFFFFWKWTSWLWQYCGQIFFLQTYCTAPNKTF